MHAVRWFEIPALDLKRAFRFYHSVLADKERAGMLGCCGFDARFGRQYTGFAFA
jgi:predicted enzyme related to lactoylglutathione lyase